MIRQITTNEFEEIESLLDDFVKTREAGFFQQQVPFQEQIKNALSTERIGLFAQYDGTQPIGFLVLGLVSSTINVLYVNPQVEGLNEIERNLFDYGFDYLTRNSTAVKIGGRNVGSTLEGYFETKGFRKFDRKHMTLSRDAIESLKSSSLSSEFKFVDYSEDLREPVADIIYKANIENIDVSVFPEFFGSLEATTRLLENIEQDRYGKFKEVHSKILIHNGNMIGVCFLTLTSEDTGYIPDICLLQEYRGKGTGKALLIHSMKEMVRLEDGLAKINLDVTIENPARYLYESLGYEIVTNYSMYSWIKNEK
ncbi:MAG: GNAT family N-acetyltransferase [Candidatus Thorarchaeota archaeon]|jgi:ribosomal protein S18 acetylase RimI-like enzyme